MKTSAVIASLGLLAPVFALATPEIASNVVARDAAPDAEADPTLFGISLGLGFGGSGCLWWKCGSNDYQKYSCNGWTFPKVWGLWGHACNQVYYGSNWKPWGDQAWGVWGKIDWQDCGAFSQQGYFLLNHNWNFKSWYGTHKDNWKGFCDDLWNNHYQKKNPCSKAQWKGYLQKWKIQEGTSCW